VVGQLDGDPRRSPCVACLEVPRVGAFAQRDAVPHLPDPPGALGHRVEVSWVQGRSGVGGDEQVECFPPRVLRRGSPRGLEFHRFFAHSAIVAPE
jgi:hypothetical protein